MDGKAERPTERVRRSQRSSTGGARYAQGQNPAAAGSLSRASRRDDNPLGTRTSLKGSECPGKGMVKVGRL